MTQIHSHFVGLQMGENPKLLAVEQRVEDSKLNMDFDFLTANLFLQSYSHLPSFLVIDIATVKWINSHVSKEHHTLGRGHQGN